MKGYMELGMDSEREVELKPPDRGQWSELGLSWEEALANVQDDK